MRLIKYMAMLAGVVGVGSAEAQMKYDDLFMEMPNMSLDQQYSELLKFQKQNPYFANAYIQLGVVCEHKMALTDPLRDIESAQFWSDNAHLFFGNFVVFYKEGDFRRNEEYYENLQIPFAGSKVTEEDIKDFVEKHEAKCRNFRDTTMMIYTAMEKSKGAYNRCIGRYMELCEKYKNMDDLLLGYDKKLDEQMTALTSDMAECEKEFKIYKSLIMAYPLMSYRQLYEKKDIETFRLDGLTNSDFLENRFTVWDFQKWVDEYRNLVNGKILPLRKEIESINKEFVDGRKAYETAQGAVDKEKLAAPYDELFVYRLGKYDNSSLVRELFAYLDARRELIAMGCDSMALNVDTAYSVMNRKMRHIYNMSVAEDKAMSALENMEGYVTEERVGRFREFFDKNYGGLDGLKSLKGGEVAFAGRVMQRALDNFAGYRKTLDGQTGKDQYSEKSAKYAALPLWPVDDYEVGSMKGNYVTKLVAREANGRVAYVAGVKKADLKTVFVARIGEDGKTAWLVEAKKVANAKALTLTSDGCIMNAEVADQPTAIVYSAAGKETLRFNLASGDLTSTRKTDVSKDVKYTYTSDGGNAVFYMVDSLGAKVMSEAIEEMERVEQTQDVAGGTMMVGTKDGNVVLKIVGGSGQGNVETIKGDGLKVEKVFRASAREICIFVTDKQKRQGLVVVSDSGKIIKSAL